MNDIPSLWLDIIRNHPLVKTGELEDRVTNLARLHFLAGLTGPDDAEPPACEVSICVMIGLLREILAYRQRYGLLETEENYIATVQGEIYEPEIGNQGRTDRSRETQPRTGSKSQN